LLEALEREGRASAIAQQPFQPGALGAFDAERSIQGESAVVVPTRHVARIGGIETASTRKPAQDPSTHPLLHCGAVLGCQRGRLGELDLPVGTLGEHAIDHAAVKVNMRIQRAAEALLRKLTAPSRPRAQPLPWRSRASITRRKICSTALIASGSCCRK
jgi:hypothetical protein